MPAGAVWRQMVKRKRAVQTCVLLALRAVFLTPVGEVRAAQYNTSAANTWIQLEADDSFSGRNGEGSELQLDIHAHQSCVVARCNMPKTTNVQQ